MTAVELLPPSEAVPANERWHELRRAGITASEIAVVMGLSPYDSPFNLYWSKVNDWQWEGNEFTRAGQHLEDAIAQWWIATQDPLETSSSTTPGSTPTPIGRGSWPLRTG
jgi:putative phage-type endonuclease